MSVDKSSRSNADVVQITHLDWNIYVDFKDRSLRCKATYMLSCATKELILDTSNLIITGVTCSSTGKALPYELLSAIEGKPHLGRALVIQLPSNGNSSIAENSVTVAYHTTEACSALQWLPPAQTAGKVYPYLFTQCQAIHARSLVPCQDATRVKFTYTATVTTPAWATAVLSAVQEQSECVNKTVISVWKQAVPISSYLLALAVGQLERRELSTRCAVYSEPAVVDAAAYEFAETEIFIQTAEKIAGTPYQWGRYDILCLPPSFSYGGMENPNMAFLTPTLLAGDRSLAGVVAHEISHAWTGNYVTCASWDDFWLNEGWTVWLERKITSRLRGPRFLDFEAIGGYNDLQDAVQAMPTEFTSLVLPIGDCDPDNAYSTVAYEKGFNLLLFLERMVGTDKFEAFFQAYIKRFSSKTVTSDEFRAFFVGHFATNVDDSTRAALDGVDWKTWYHAPGMPPAVADYDRSLAEASERLANHWISVDRLGSMLPLENVHSWSSGQITCFLDAMLSSTLSSQPLKVSTLRAMNSLYCFATSKNSEILLRYCRLAIAAEDESILPLVICFITSQGRMKYIRPLYKALFESKIGKEVAVQTFLAHKDFYHPIGAKMVALDLSVSIKSAGGDSAGSGHDDKSGKKMDVKVRIVWAVGVAAVAVAFALLRRKR